MLQIHDKTFEIYLRNDEIQAKVAEIARALNEAYDGKDTIFIAVLNGAFMFASDLMKHISLSCEITFVKVSSYQGMNSTGRVDEVIGLTTDIRGKHVVIIEDIVDTGITMDKIHTLLAVEHPASVKIASLLFKPDAFKGKNKPDFIGFSIPDAFVVGYGLDYNEHGRNTQHIYQLTGSSH